MTSTDVVRVIEIGWKAHAALQRAGGVARVVTVLSESVYLDADGTLVWLGRASAPLHPRAMLTRETLAIQGDGVRVECGTDAPWRPASLEITPRSGALIRRGGEEVRAAIVAAMPPDGLGILLLGQTHDGASSAGSSARRPETVALLNRAAPHCRALSRACLADDPDAATESATALIGLGPGLTPSGDDFVGGALFARSLLARAASRDADRWAAAGREIVRRACDLTHPISVTLLEDMSRGDGHAPLHELAAALVIDDRAAAFDAARRLVRIGHSSGWDMLAGFLSTWGD